MPHLHLTTSSDLVENVDVPDILCALVRELSGIESIQPQAIKAYHTLHNTWCMGEGAPGGFAHLEVRVPAGRPPEIRKAIADGLYAAMRKAFRGSLEANEVSLTLELREMDVDTYRK